MSTKPADDFDAVRAIVEALAPFETKDQERIIRWAREKIGLAGQENSDLAKMHPTPGIHSALPVGELQSRDIRSFVDSKNPQSDNQFATVIAYYYRFEAPESERKIDITAEDLQDAARKAGRDRFPRPAQTLVNAHGQGYLDKVDRGHYALNTVGENLVAMALPQTTANGSRRPNIPKRRKANRAPSKKK